MLFKRHRPERLLRLSPKSNEAPIERPSDTAQRRMRAIVLRAHHSADRPCDRPASRAPALSGARVPCPRYRFDARTPRLGLIGAHLGRQVSSTAARCPPPPASPAQSQRPCRTRASCTACRHHGRASATMCATSVPTPSQPAQHTRRRQAQFIGCLRPWDGYPAVPSPPRLPPDGASTSLPVYSLGRVDRTVVAAARNAFGAFGAFGGNFLAASLVADYHLPELSAPCTLLIVVFPWWRFFRIFRNSPPGAEHSSSCLGFTSVSPRARCAGNVFEVAH